MTKREFQQRFGDKATELLANPTFHIALDVAREECPYVNGGGAVEATNIIRNEGRMTGWSECLRFLKTIGHHEQQPEKPKATPLYPDPDQRKSDQNK